MHPLKQHPRRGQVVPSDASPLPPKRIVISKDLPSVPSLSMDLRRSQPIPIKKCEREPSQHEEEEVDTAPYDLATWNMYILITNARRLRAFSRSTSGDCSYEDPVAHVVQPVVAEVDGTVQESFSDSVSPDLHQPSFDEYYHDAIFDLDPM